MHACAVVANIWSLLLHITAPDNARHSYDAILLTALCLHAYIALGLQ